MEGKLHRCDLLLPVLWSVLQTDSTIEYQYADRHNQHRLRCRSCHNEDHLEYQHQVLHQLIEGEQYKNDTKALDDYRKALAIYDDKIGLYSDDELYTKALRTPDEPQDWLRQSINLLSSFWIFDNERTTCSFLLSLFIF